MTWRTSLYLLTVLLAAVVVATTAMSDNSESVNAQDRPQVAAQMEPMAMPLTEHGSRMALLALGIGAVVVTYRHAWRNFRPKV
jgi:outer membrane PBP1 activator LpoA protein